MSDKFNYYTETYVITGTEDRDNFQIVVGRYTTLFDGNNIIVKVI